MKKLLAIIISVVLVIGVMPLAAFAGEGPMPYDEETCQGANLWAYELNSDGEPAEDEDGAMITYYLYDAAASSFDDEEPIDEPIDDQPIDDEPIDDEPIDDEPIDDEPIDDEPIDDEPYEEPTIEGAYYDLESNTLYLDNVDYAELAIEANNMGDDFTVSVSGVCSIAKITVNNNEYGGSLKFDGTGKLVVNKDGYCETAILVAGVDCESVLDFGEKVTVEAYGDEYAAAVYPTMVEDGEQAIVFENGEKHEVESSLDYEESPIMILGFSLLDPEEVDEPQVYGYKAECADDPEGDYVFRDVVDEETGETSYVVLKLVYVEEYDTYIPDINFGDQGGYQFTEEEWPNSGFTPVLDDEENLVPFVNENPAELHVMFEATYEDGTKCALNMSGFDEEFNLLFDVYDITEVEGVDGIYYVVPNDEATVDDVTMSVNIVYNEGVYRHTINEAEFKYVGIEFPDVPTNAWFYEAAMYNAYNGFIGGYENGKFGPADALQRQDFVVILARIAGVNLSEYEGQESSFEDVKADAYYAAAVAWAVDFEIIKGYDNGKFGVGDKITREQVATILYRALGDDSGDEGALAGFADSAKISAFAKDAMAWAVSNGIITGKNATTLAPTATASRAEIATIIMRMDKQGMFNTY